MNPAGPDFTVHGHKGLTRTVPHGVYAATLRGATNPAIWILLCVYYARFFTFFRRVHPSECLLALFPIVYVLILSFSPKTHHRYFLPDTLLFCTLAVFGLFCFKLPGSPALTRVVQVMAFLAAWGMSEARLIPYDSAFKIDSRQKLFAFIKQ
jgi:hypothetical protein